MNDNNSNTPKNGQVKQVNRLKDASKPKRSSSGGVNGNGKPTNGAILDLSKRLSPLPGGSGPVNSLNQVLSAPSTPSAEPNADPYEGMTIRGKPVRPFTWTQQKELAAQMIAQGKLTMTEIAEQIGRTREAIDLWRCHPEFANRVLKLLDDYKRAVLSRGIALLERRVDSYIDDFDATDRILKQRAKGYKDKEHVGAEGGLDTGFIAVDWKGKEADQPVYKFDEGLLKGRLALREKVARELGQWKEKTEHTGDFQPINFTIIEGGL